MTSLISKLTEHEMLAPLFGGDSWDAWRCALDALFGETPHDMELYRRCTGRETVVPEICEGWFIVGRRGGKSQIAALIAVFLSCFREYKVAPGETPVLMIVAANKRQARVTMRYVAGILNATPELKGYIASEKLNAIELVNGINIEVHVGNYRAIRGHTVVGAVCDEIAFWWTDEGKAHPDTEILNAIRPSMATQPNAKLVAISSPYARRGEMWRAYKEHYGKHSDVLVWQADTQTMNPTVPQRIIKRAYEDDPAVAAAEYGAQFRTDVESFVTREAIEACTPPGRLELPPVGGTRYFAFTDPSGGSQDSFTLAIAHMEDEKRVLDAIREVHPPFSPESVVADYAEFLLSYDIHHVTGDRYGGEWPREQFKKYGISYQITTRAKSEIYRDLLPLVNSARVELLDNPRMHSQFVGLERRTNRGGRDSIDHAPGGHDDLINAAAGALVEIVSARRGKRKGAVWGREKNLHQNSNNDYR